jgi:hypothetical protein
VTNQGKLRWMVVDGAVNGPTFIRFLERLIRGNCSPSPSASSASGCGLRGELR